MVDVDVPLTIEQHMEINKQLHVYKQMYPNKVVDVSQEVKPMSKMRAKMLQQMEKREKSTGKAQGTIKGLPILEA